MYQKNIELVLEELNTTRDGLDSFQVRESIRKSMA